MNCYYVIREWLYDWRLHPEQTVDGGVATVVCGSFVGAPSGVVGIGLGCGGATYALPTGGLDPLGMMRVVDISQVMYDPSLSVGPSGTGFDPGVYYPDTVSGAGVYGAMCAPPEHHKTLASWRYLGCDNYVQGRLNNGTPRVNPECYPAWWCGEAGNSYSVAWTDPFVIPP